jgi:glycosyltransferase involved in cell wall biosynthesis
MKLSVALCTYNGEKFIKEQIDSILSQTLAVNEIIICDDGSNDNTISILEGYQKKHPDILKIFKNELNLKSVKNFEKAISLCTGDIIFLSDQDDIWKINKTDDYVAFFLQNPNISTIASNGYCINEKSEILKKYALWDIPQFLKEEQINFDYHKLIFYVINVATGASMAFRKELCSEILPFPIIKNFHHDEWIAMVSSRKEQFILLNDKYFYYRIHSNQQVGGVFYQKKEQVQNYLIMFAIIFQLNNKKPSFSNYKKVLKQLANVHKKSKEIEQHVDKKSKYRPENKTEIVQLFQEIKKNMQASYPIATFLLSIPDLISKKRKLDN